MPFAAVLDASVLYPLPLRDTLLRGRHLQPQGLPGRGLRPFRHRAPPPRRLPPLPLRPRRTGGLRGRGATGGSADAPADDHRRAPRPPRADRAEPRAGTPPAPVAGDAPERIRTSDLRFRRPTLYPAELRAPAREEGSARRGVRRAYGCLALGPLRAAPSRRRRARARGPRRSSHDRSRGRRRPGLRPEGRSCRGRAGPG